MLRNPFSIKELKIDDRTWMIESVEGFEKNPRNDKEPMVHVIVKPLTKDAKPPYFSASDSIGQEKKVVTVGLGQSPLLRKGSLWKDGLTIGSAGDLKTFENVMISKETVTSIRSYEKNGGVDCVLPPEFHHLGPSWWADNLLVSQDNGKFDLIVPKTEVLRFYYAQSTQLAHALFSNSFSGDMSSVIVPHSLAFREEDKAAIIGLRKKYSKTESRVVARIVFSDIARRGAQMVFDSVNREYLNRKPKESQAFVRADTGFPFEGVTQIQAWGKPVLGKDKVWRFWVFSLVSCSGAFPYGDLLCKRFRLISNENSQAGGAEGSHIWPISYPMIDDDSIELQSEEGPASNVVPIVSYFSASRFTAIEGNVLKMLREDQDYEAGAGWKVVSPLVPSALSTGVGTRTKSTVASIRLEPGNDDGSEPPMGDDMSLFVEIIEILNKRDGVSALRRRSRLNPRMFLPLVSPKAKAQWSYLESGLYRRRRIIACDIQIAQKFFLIIDIEKRDGDLFTLAILWSVDFTKITDERMSEISNLIVWKVGRWEAIGERLPQGVGLETMRHTWSSSAQVGAKRIFGRIASLIV